MTLCDLKRFRTITHDELFSKGWDKKEAEKRKLVPNIFKFTSHFNQLSFWSALEVLKESSAKGRAEKITYFLKMSKVKGQLSVYAFCPCVIYSTLFRHWHILGKEIWLWINVNVLSAPVTTFALNVKYFVHRPTWVVILIHQICSF